ncbi:dipicolinate synthase subunit DpsA [Salibacterium sp. K-3]
MKKEVLLAGGDERQIETAGFLMEHGFTVSMLGFAELVDMQDGISIYRTGQEPAWESLDAVVFPAGGIGREWTVEAPYADAPLKIECGWLQRLSPETLICTGVSTKEADQLMKRAERTYTALLEKEEAAIYNAVPTAEGVLLTAIKETNHTIHHSRVVILGFGRTGSVIADTFSALGAYTEAGTSDPLEKARAETSGHSVFDLDALAEAVERADICINTIPALLLTKTILRRVSVRTLIIDIASRPGGTDFRYAEEKGIHALRTPGIPGKTAPKTAGRILGRVLLQQLGENEKIKEA